MHDQPLPVRPRSIAAKLLSYHRRLWLALLSGALIFLLCPPEWRVITRVLTAWNGAVLVLLPLTYLWASRLDPRRLRYHYEDEDPTAPVILLVVAVVTTLLSIVAIVALLSTLKQAPPAERAGHLVLSALTVLDSWLLLATTQAGVCKVVVLHSIISFFFNVSILGFAINVTAGLLGNT